MKTMKAAFGFGGDNPVPAKAKAEGVPEEAYATPSPNYVFEETRTRKLLRFLLGQPARRNLMLVGAPGVGKTSVINETAARLNIPVFSLSCSGKIRLDHMVGGYEMVGGGTRWRDGPLVMAMRAGGIFLANEITRLDPGEQMSLAEALDSRATITIPDTGEVVRAADGFRFAATGNSGGYGDSTRAYDGEKSSSVAFLDRFQVWEVEHLSAEEEEALVAKETRGRVPAEVIAAAVRFANEVRQNFVGNGGKLKVILSTRSLVVWMREAVGYGSIPGIQDPVMEALDDTVLNGVPADQKQVVKDLWTKWVNG